MSVPSLASRTVNFDHEGKHYETSYAKLSTLLFQWQNLLLVDKPDPAQYIAAELGWDFPLTDAHLEGFSRQLEATKAEYLEQCKAEVFASMGQTVPDGPKIAPPDTEPLQEARRFSIPVEVDQTTELQVDGGSRAKLVMDIACMVMFMLLVNPIVDEFGLKVMQEAGCDREEIATAVAAIKEARRNRGQ